jgi:hypothetical protein
MGVRDAPRASARRAVKDLFFAARPSPSVAPIGAIAPIAAIGRDVVPAIAARCIVA